MAFFPAYGYKAVEKDVSKRVAKRAAKGVRDDAEGYFGINFAVLKRTSADRVPHMRCGAGSKTPIRELSVRVGQAAKRGRT